MQQDSKNTPIAENEVRIWLHKPAGSVARRHDQSILARRLLRGACREAGIDPPDSIYSASAIELFVMLKRKSGVEVSIAHCPKLMAVALSRGRVGIDCEMPKARRDWQGIADQFFTPEEAAAVACEGEGLFLHYWTMKEAFLKATRGELWADLNALTIEGQQILITNPESAGSQWHFWHREMEGSAVGACMEGDGKWRVEIYHCTVPGTIVRQGRK